MDAPDATCDPGEFSAPTPINLKREDGHGNIRWRPPGMNCG